MPRSVPALPGFLLSTTNKYTSQENQSSANKNLDDRQGPAHPEVAVADKGDREKLEADHPEGHVQSHPELRQEERQRVQDASHDRRDTCN